MNYSFCYDQLRLEALCQMSSFLSKMEEKSSGFTVSPEFPALLQSVQLQFLSGCFALGTQIIGSHSGANYEMQHYMVHLVIMLSQYLCRCLWSARTERKDEWIFNSSQMEGGETFLWHLHSVSYLNSVWYAFSFFGYAKRATFCSSHLLPAGGVCPQTEGHVGKRTSRCASCCFTCVWTTLMIIFSFGFT